MNNFSHLSYQELENRKKFLKHEYHRVCEELDRRKKNNQKDGDLWEAYENSKEKMVRQFQFPSAFTKEIIEEERNLTKKGNESIRNIINQVKTGIQNEIGKNVGLLDNGVERLLKIGDKISQIEKKQSIESNQSFKLAQTIEENKEDNEEEEEENETESSEDDVEEVDMDNNESLKESSNLKTQIPVTNTTVEQPKKRVLTKKKNNYENINPKIRDLWSSD